MLHTVINQKNGRLGILSSRYISSNVNVEFGQDFGPPQDKESRLCNELWQYRTKASVHRLEHWSNDTAASSASPGVCQRSRLTALKDQSWENIARRELNGMAGH